MVLAPRYNTHKEQSREHFCQAASYITVLSIIPHRNTTIRLSCDGLSLLVKSCLFGGGTIDKTLISYLDFERLYALHQSAAFFVIRSKSNTALRRLYSNPVDKDSGVRCDQIVVLDGFYAQQRYPEKLRRIKFYDAQRDKRLSFLTNQFILPAATIADLYRCRWQVEIFFKWIKQHLRIKAFYGTSDNAVKTQIWIAVCVYVLVAIVKKRMQVSQSLYTILQILSVTLFHKKPLYQAFAENGYKNEITSIGNQLKLFDS